MAKEPKKRPTKKPRPSASKGLSLRGKQNPRDKGPVKKTKVKSEPKTPKITKPAPKSKSKEKAPSKKGLTLRQVLSKEHPTVKRSKRGVALAGMTKNNKHNRITTKTLTTELIDGRRVRNRHVQTIQPKDTEYKGKLSSPNTLLTYQCDCEFFTFHCEVAFYKKGAAQIINSNGDLPVVTNPRMQIYPCKHLAIVLPLLLKKKL